VRPSDPVAIGAVVAIIRGAWWRGDIPAPAATRVDRMIVLREEWARR
jgi:hypothetical protein